MRTYYTANLAGIFPIHIHSDCKPESISCFDEKCYCLELAYYQQIIILITSAQAYELRHRTLVFMTKECILKNVCLCPISIPGRILLKDQHGSRMLI